VAKLTDRPALSANGRCDECGFDNSTMDNAALVDAIATFAADPNLLTDRRPLPDVWSPREYAWHMREAFAFYEERIDLVLTSDRPQLEGRDFTVNPIPSREPVDSTHLVARLRALAPAEWARVGLGSSDGSERDIRNLASRLAHECVHHGLDIEKGVRVARS
jgi:hypothetical protein